MWRTSLGAIAVMEQVLRMGRRGPRYRPFCQAAGVKPGGYSKLLERALTDFGAEESFARAAARFQEHYGQEVSASAVRRLTYRHARKIQGLEPTGPAKPAQTLITQIDGSMVPLVKPAPSGDRRKGKTLLWAEARLCCSRAAQELRPIYGATLGSLETVCWLWRQTAQSCGLSPKTFVHGIGDGAPWIVERFKENFGAQGKYLIDFYHVSEYLAAAALPIAGLKKAPRWLKKQKARLMLGQTGKILRSLQAHQEAPEAAETPIRDAFRYLQQRLDHLHYAQSRKAALPIGSGEVESAHRHIIQHRLKLAGAWWKETNAQAMLGLRVARANDCWKAYWISN